MLFHYDRVDAIFTMMMKMMMMIVKEGLPMLVFEQFGNLLAELAEVRPLVHVARPAFLMTS